MKHIFSILLTLALIAGTSFAQSTAEKFAGLLPDMASNDMGKQERAQQDWQKICFAAGAPGKTADRAEVNKLMITELAKDDTPLDTRLWLLEQLQWTGDASVVPTVVTQLENKDNRVRDRAARALAHNTSSEAEAALKTAIEKSKQEGGVRNQTVVEALLSRKQDLSTAIETLPPQSLPYVSQAEFDNYIKGYNELSLIEKARALTAIKVRKDKKYAKLVVNEIKNEDEFISNNAVFALEKVAGTNEVPVLVDLLFNGKNGDVVRWTLERTAADGFDEALLKALSSEKDNERYNTIARLLVNRNVKGVVKPLLERAIASDTQDRLYPLELARAFATGDDVGTYIDVALLYKPGRDLDRAAGYVAQLIPGEPDAVLKKITAQNVDSVFTIVGRIGGQKSLDAVKKELDGANKVAAIRALSNWPNAIVADDLLKLATGNEPEATKIQALRAYIRVMTLRSEDLGIRISDKDRVAKLRKAMEIATRVDEKRFILDRLEPVRCVEAAQFAAEYLDNNDLQGNACKAVVELAHHNNIRQPNKTFFEPALKKVISITKDNGLKERAERYLAQ
jgi:HEAT repeat protein